MASHTSSIKTTIPVTQMILTVIGITGAKDDTPGGLWCKYTARFVCQAIQLVVDINKKIFLETQAWCLSAKVCYSVYTWRKTMALHFKKPCHSMVKKNYYGTRSLTSDITTYNTVHFLQLYYTLLPSCTTYCTPPPLHQCVYKLAALYIYATIF